MIKTDKKDEVVISAETSAFLEELRFQAEKLVTPHTSASISNLTFNEISGLVHELETHQIELEMQNRELILTQEALVDTHGENLRLYKHAPVGLLSMNYKGHILKANNEACQLLNTSNAIISGKLFTNFIVDEDQDLYYLHNRQALISGHKESCQIRLKTAEGGLLWIRLDSLCDAVASEQELKKVRLVLIDISELKMAEAELLVEKNKADVAMDLLTKLNTQLQAELSKKESMQKKLQHMVTHDQLTDLPNRASINEKAYNAISLSHKLNERVGLMILSLDNLSSINDAEGYVVGDLALVKASLNIKESIRLYDVVGRWGGSKFMVIFPHCESIQEMEIIARRILRKTKIPLEPLEEDSLSLSIGLALYSSHNETTTRFISQAESCLQEAMKKGGNQYVSSN